MTLKPLTCFQHFTTHHCVTGSMRHICVFNDRDPQRGDAPGAGRRGEFQLLALQRAPRWHRLRPPTLQAAREDLPDLLRVGLALCFLHHPPDEETQHPLLAA